MNCDEARGLYSARYDGELTPSQRDGFDSHLVICPGCAVDYKKYQALLKDVNSLPCPKAPDYLRNSALRAAQSGEVKRVKEEKSAKAPAKLPGRERFAFTGAPLKKAAVFLAGAAASFVCLSLIVSLASGIRGAMAENADDGFVGWQFEREMLLTVESRIAFASYPDTTAFLAESFYEQSYNINVEVDNIKAAEALINGLDGYSLNANAWYGDYGGSAEYRRRVTIGDYARAKEVLRNLGAVSYETEYANKLADEVYDLEARLLAKEEEVGRLKALLAESRTMDVLAAVERRLGWVESERDDLRGRLNQLYDISSMPYLNISLTEKAPEVEPIPEDEFLDKLGQSFIRSFNGMVSFMESFVVWLIGALIPLLLVAAFVLIAVFVIRGKRRGRKGIGKEDRQ